MAPIVEVLEVRTAELIKSAGIPAAGKKLAVSMLAQGIDEIQVVRQSHDDGSESIAIVPAGSLAKAASGAPGAKALSTPITAATAPDGTKVCPTCKGTGAILMGNVTCPLCKGKGYATPAQILAKSKGEQTALAHLNKARSGAGLPELTLAKASGASPAMQLGHPIYGDGMGAPKEGTTGIKADETAHDGDDAVGLAAGEVGEGDDADDPVLTPEAKTDADGQA